MPAADLLLVPGTSAVVYPVAGLPELATGAALVEIAPEPTPLTARADLSIRGPAGSFLAPLLSSLDPPRAEPKAPDGSGGRGGAVPTAQEEER
jgi:NAD-dependent SIR2 family protein deacetylase